MDRLATQLLVHDAPMRSCLTPEVAVARLVVTVIPSDLTGIGFTTVQVKFAPSQDVKDGKVLACLTTAIRAVTLEGVTGIQTVSLEITK